MDLSVYDKDISLRNGHIDLKIETSGLIGTQTFSQAFGQNDIQD